MKREVIDFSVNINPLGLPKGVKGIIAKNSDLVSRYPDPSSKDLKRRIASLHRVDSENIAIGNGSIELIHIIPRSLGIKKALIIVPTFSEYEYAVRSNGSTPLFFHTYEKDGFRIDLDALSRHLGRCDGLFLCNPNNPTGSMLYSDEVLYLSRLAKKRGTILILDEAFIEFVLDPDETAIISNAVKNSSLLILRSLTKIFAMPGLRLGYAIGHKNMIKRITCTQYPWNVNGLAQAVAERILTDKDYIARTRSYVVKERRYMLKKLNKIRLIKTYPASANFILCRLVSGAIRSSEDLTKKLLRNGIYIRNCGNFRGLDKSFFRVAVRKRSDNDKLISSIKRALG